MTCAQLADEEREFIGPCLPVGRFGPYPERLREQFEGVLWRFRTGSQWREIPARFGAWQTVCNRFMRWRDAGVFQALLEEAIAGAACGDDIDMSLVSADSTTARAHHDAAGMRVSEETLAALEEAASEKGERARNKADRTAKTTLSKPSGDASAVGGGPGPRPPCSAGPAAG
ncbi:transposase [Streptomyces bauhiniae]|uniref:Transposase n=1 Tax=Streptomyces bauhiniae TaxID=2340725 RepID=A0A7K3QNA1_9ACTN|nr:transposase [Streptomyces bauhiniae]